MAYVYRHIRKDTNEVFYIGIGKTKRRMNSIHDRNKYWNNIVNKVGFYYEIIEDNLTWEEACEKEKYWIKFYGRKELNEGILVNMTDGGEGNNNFSEEVLNKIRESSKGRVCSEETKQKLRGKTLSIEARKKISEKNKGKIVSDETRLKLSIANKSCKPPSQKGNIRSEEVKKKISEKNKGRILTEETRQRIAFASANRSEEAKINKSEGLKAWWKRRKSLS